MTPEQAAASFPSFIKLSPDDGALELYLDHHMLSTLRLCEAKFYEEFISHPGFNLGAPSRRYWSLDFGILLHDCLDQYYNSFLHTNQAPQLDSWLGFAKDKWAEMNMEEFKPSPTKLVKEYYTDEKKYHTMGGYDGFARLLVQYYAFYMNQRFRVIATEISFGRGKEVFLGEFRIPRWKYWEGPEGESDVINESWDIVRCYLSGRIDLLVDNGYKIGPVDHKHTARFDGYESDDYNPHEGIAGYIYAINSILSTRFPDSPHKICRDGWIFHISAADCNPRFKPSLISKTPQQLGDFAKRQLSTFKRVVELIIANRVPDWNTYACNNIFNSKCPFHELHRQPYEQREGTIKQFYEIKEAWNPARPPKK